MAWRKSWRVFFSKNLKLSLINGIYYWNLLLFALKENGEFFLSCDLLTSLFGTQSSRANENCYAR